METIEQVIEKAQSRLDLETAQNPALRRAIHIVELFLRKTRRVCYGGQAVNAQLPKKDQFYDSDKSLPDYDFFSPDAKGDIELLIHHIKKAGYTEISKRIGIHDGTLKLYVNYISIADITQSIPEFYENIYKKSVVINGIHYADPIFLRMAMYLEISRPRGQVARWDKVYERLLLLDKTHPIPNCTTAHEPLTIDLKTRLIFMRYIVTNHRAFMGTDTQLLLKKSSASSRTRVLLNSLAPVIFLSPDAQHDADILAEYTSSRKESIVGYQNILPAMVALYHNTQLIGLIVQEESCHSILLLPLTKYRQLRVASLYTFLTFLIGLYYREKLILITEKSFFCLLRIYIDLLNRYRIRPTKLVPAFPIECSGYQTSFPSLLRAKVARIEAARQEISSGRQTRKRTKRLYRNVRSRETRRR